MTLPSIGVAHPTLAEPNSSGRIGRFDLVDKLGQGGMGVVFRARDAEFERNVAIKLLRWDAARVDVRWLVREAQGLARLAHPNVVAVHEIGEHDGSLFIAMEYVEGPTLREWLGDEARPWLAKLEVLRQSGRGLEAAHKAGLIHRDYKPGNVIVGIDGRTRVLDFGLVRESEAPIELEQDSSLTKIGIALAPSSTRTGMIVGTPAYMAPSSSMAIRPTRDPTNSRSA